MSNRRRAGVLLAVLVAAGCGGGSAGEVSGVVTVDGKTPAEGSSITFVPAGGAGTGGGDVIRDGKYTAKLSAGTYKVEIRIPRPKGKMPKATPEQGPGGGPGGPANIEESLPEKYHDKSELTFDVKPGKNEKNWEVNALPPSK